VATTTAAESPALTHVRRFLAGLALAVFAIVMFARAASAAGSSAPPVTSKPPVAVEAPASPGNPATGRATISVDLGGQGKPSQSITIIGLLTVLSVAPALLVMVTSFTRIVIVLSLTRNALGLQGVPPNQVLVGLALFLSLFVMGPTLKQMNEQALQPYLLGEISQAQAYQTGAAPLKTWMLKQTRMEELAMFVKASGEAKPKDAQSVSLPQLVPAFVLSELKTAFLIGFVIFIPFLVIDMVVSSSLMSMGMMMLPPVTVSLPFKVLLFVLVDGWALITKSLLQSFVT
jgi:flagellar biosynthetic protein FliP